MKYLLLVLALIVEANAFFNAVAMNIATADNNANVTTMEDLEKMVSDQIDAAFANATNACEDCHPSVKIPLDKIGTCFLGQPNLVNVLKKEFLQQYMNAVQNVSAEEKENDCRRHRDGYDGFVQCIISVASTSPNDRNFLAAFHKTIELYRGLVCGKIDVTKIVNAYMNIEELLSQLPSKYHEYLERAEFMAKNGIKPSEKDSCLPVRIAEAAEIVTILSGQFEFAYHDHIASAVHFIATVLGGFPFKSYDECA